MANEVSISSHPPENKARCKTPKTDSILYIDDQKENDLVQFINKAIQQGFNCLELSKRKITEFPCKLLEFTSLQYLYLESNQLTELPNDIFTRLTMLKWLDLRNNKLTSIPNYGLAQHQCLQSLLLGGNNLRTLPCELGRVKTLTALNLDGNPLDHPPFHIIKRGIKAIQKCLREKLDSNELSSASILSSASPSLNGDHDDDNDNDNDNQNQNQNQRAKPLTQQASLIHRKSRSETSYYDVPPTNVLPAHLQPCLQFKRMTCSAIRPSTQCRQRPQSEMRLYSTKTRVTSNKSNDFENVSPVHDRPFTQSRLRDTKTNDELYHVYQRTYTPSKEFEEPLVHTPFHIDPSFIPLLNKNQQDLMKHESRRMPTPKYPVNEDDRKRLHDQKIQDRIRQITDKMLKRRFEARQSLFNEKRQVKIELRELRRLETATSHQRPICQMNARFKAIYNSVNSQKKS